MNCIDLYSGIGGWTLGMKLNGIEHIKSFEWNKESNLTHNINFGTNTKEIDIRKLDFNSLPKVGSIDFVVGSPPCTQFSYANRGGGGDIQDGLVDMYQFLSVVEYLKPKYWAMENVPRVKNILEKVLNEDPKFKRFKKLFNYLEVVDSSEFGLPQKRKRMIGGNFPHHLFEAYKAETADRTLGDVLNALKGEKVTDPIYGYELSREELTDHIIEASLNPEELRLNRESKEYHPVYNGMSFPENLTRPSRTITSTCTRVSRESLVIQNGVGFRRLTVRERGMLMGFPITYQYYGKTYNSKLKMIGNAIPPVVTYYLFQSMLETPVRELTLIENAHHYRHESPGEPIPITPPDKAKFKYRDDRSFRLAIPEYRFGSGVRFELSNKFVGTICAWKVRFFYGSSKKINEVLFTDKSHKQILELLKIQNINIDKKVKELKAFSETLSSEELQKKWTHKSQEYIHPYDVLDTISRISLDIRNNISDINISDSEFASIVGDNLNTKLFDNKALVISGIISGYVFNKHIKA
ncbi:DNA (cytosine-5-)-methyltransferase [Echinicola sp. CAU 1574]|uniref:Cytosine-specific methyltransferase n=1 Tax=Echinicola arenosa TaxID=2774144 RepID=A0ABR9AMR8_9BACT|nr:DNA (cytosine-5-)-methyltransferase [Echinicola arenosa]MBD8489185.1 DNA (cytosine-5-)-methyltransferase [Echinicola arenosa]